ncbi:MAG: type II toxin-antitoxin system VapC family toxin [Polyangiaceae bacterium]|nr:type II toxin-antitoxin system VapC family toxin [Polyangiaceae bacterium]
MRLVVDTDVIAAALLGEEARGSEAARLLASASELLSPAHWKAELANVIWKSVVFAGNPPERLNEIFRVAESLPITSVEVSELWRGAVARAITSRQSVYDTLFVELALREGLPLASYDAPLRRKFPRVVALPKSLLRN